MLLERCSICGGMEYAKHVSSMPSWTRRCFACAQVSQSCPYYTLTLTGGLFGACWGLRWVVRCFPRHGYLAWQIPVVWRCFEPSVILPFFSGQICLELPWVIPPQIVIMVGTLRLRGVNIRNNHVSYPGDDLGEGISLEGITFCRPPGWLWSEAIHRVFDNHRYTQSGYTRICWVGTVYEHVWLGLVGFMSIITIAITCYNCSLVGL